MAQYSWNHRAGGWVRDDRGGRPVGPVRSRRLDRGVGPLPPSGGRGLGGPMGSGDRVPRRPNGPLPTMGAELDLPRV